MGCPTKKIIKCHKKTIVVYPRKKKKRCVIVKKKIVKPPRVKLTINVDPTPVNVNPTLTLSTSRKVCTQFPSSTFSFFNGANIFIPVAGTASPYPSTITVSGLTGPITNVTATIFLISHNSPGELDILLVGPDGSTNTMLMSDAGDGFVISEVTLTIDDNAANFISPLQITEGTFKPTNFEVQENLPAPAPPTFVPVALSNFNGLDPNGTWSLFINNDAFGIGFEGSIFEWALSISTPETEECIFTPL